VQDPDHVEAPERYYPDGSGLGGYLADRPAPRHGPPAPPYDWAGHYERLDRERAEAGPLDAEEPTRRVLDAVAAVDPVLDPWEVARRRAQEAARRSQALRAQVRSDIDADIARSYGSSPNSVTPAAGSSIYVPLGRALITGAAAMRADLQDMANGEYTGRHSDAWLNRERPR